jgi:hypothetical protein
MAIVIIITIPVVINITDATAISNTTDIVLTITVIIAKLLLFTWRTLIPQALIPGVFIGLPSKMAEILQEDLIR